MSYQPFALGDHDPRRLPWYERDGRRVVVADHGPAESPVLLLDADTGEPVRTLSAGPERGTTGYPVTTLSAYRGRPVVAVGSGDSPRMDGRVGYFVRQVDVSSGLTVGPDIPAAARVEAVAAFRWRGDDIIVVGDRDGLVRPFSATTGSPVGAGFTCGRPVMCLAVWADDDEAWIACGDRGGVIRAWHLPTERLAWSSQPHWNDCGSIEFAVAGGRLYGVSCGLSAVAVWDGRTGAAIGELRFTDDAPCAVPVVLDGRLCVYAGGGRFATRYDATTGELLGPTTVLPDAVDAVAAIHAAGRDLMYAVSDRAIIRIDARSGAVIAPDGSEVPLVEVRFDRDRMTDPRDLGVEPRRLAFPATATVGDVLPCALDMRFLPDVIGWVDDPHSWSVTVGSGADAVPLGVVSGGVDPDVVYRVPATTPVDDLAGGGPLRLHFRPAGRSGAQSHSSSTVD